MQENSLTIFERGNQLLAEANTVQKAKELKDLALTAADWAKHKGLGEEAVKLAMSYAMDASRRMGELLQSTERAKGADVAGKPKKIDGTRTLPSNRPPTLEEIGISKNESSRAQKLAALPEETFQKVKSGEIPVSNIKQVHPSVTVDKGREKAIQHAVNAINELKKIPVNEESRREAFKMVKNYINQNSKEVVLQLLGTIPEPSSGGTEAPEQHEK